VVEGGGIKHRGGTIFVLERFFVGKGMKALRAGKRASKGEDPFRKKEHVEGGNKDWGGKKPCAWNSCVPSWRKHIGGEKPFGFENPFLCHVQEKLGFF